MKLTNYYPHPEKGSIPPSTIPLLDTRSNSGKTNRNMRHYQDILEKGKVFLSMCKPNRRDPKTPNVRGKTSSKQLWYTWYNGQNPMKSPKKGQQIPTFQTRSHYPSIHSSIGQHFSNTFRVSWEVWDIIWRKQTMTNILKKKKNPISELSQSKSTASRWLSYDGLQNQRASQGTWRVKEIRGKRLKEKLIPVTSELHIHQLRFKLVYAEMIDD